MLEWVKGGGVILGIGRVLCRKKINLFFSRNPPIRHLICDLSVYKVYFAITPADVSNLELDYHNKCNEDLYVLGYDAVHIGVQVPAHQYASHHPPVHQQKVPCHPPEDRNFRVSSAAFFFFKS